MAGPADNDYAEMMEGDLRDRIAERAYFRAEQRGFAPGYELEDWIEAEREVRAELLAEEAEGEVDLSPDDFDESGP